MREFENVRETVVVGDLRRSKSGNGNKIRETNIIMLLINLIVSKTIRRIKLQDRYLYNICITQEVIRSCELTKYCILTYN